MLPQMWVLGVESGIQKGLGRGRRGKLQQVGGVYCEKERWGLTQDRKHTQSWP